MIYRTAVDFAPRLGELLDVPLVICEPSSGKPEFHGPKGRRDRSASVQNAAQPDGAS